MSDNVFETLSGFGVIPVVEVERAEDAVGLATSLAAAGLLAIEITLRTPAALDAISLVSEAHPQMCVGAGTILTVEQVDAAMAAGATFGVSPGLGAAALEANSRGWPFIPGAVTPTEALAAFEKGFSRVKIFPAAAFGGPATVQALSAPLRAAGLSFMPTGGISAANAKDYLALESVFAVGGTWIAPKPDIGEQRWELITQRASAALALKAAARI